MSSSLPHKKSKVPASTPSPNIPPLLPSALSKNNHHAGSQHIPFTTKDPDDPIIALRSAVASTDPEAGPDPTERPEFSPFFTLIEDTTTGEHYHPTVHYIFSDDDTDLVTDAALRLHEGSSSLLPPSPSHTTNNDSDNDNDNANDASDQHGNKPPPTLAPSRPGINERYILLTLSPPGTAISSAQSMTPDWQILNAEIGAAPTWDGGGEAAGGEGGAGFMLRVEGTEGTKRLGREEVEKSGMEGLMEAFGRGMDELRRVVEGWEVLEGGEEDGKV